MRTLLVGLTLVLTAGAVQAATCRGIPFPDTAQVEGTTLALNGLGLRLATMLKVKVYVAALYVPKASSDAATILASATPSELVLHFLRDVGADDMTKAWDEGFEQNAKAQLPALKPRLETLEGWMTDMKAGQRMTFTFMHGVGVKVDVNGAVKGTIKGDDFAKAFLSVWLGHPPNPEVKAGLLGGKCD